jgi:hypothetical protein
MGLLTVRPAEVKFPARCVTCGGEPRAALTLEAFRGVDVLVVRSGRRYEVEAPFCTCCRARHRRGRVLWFAGLLAAVIGVVVAPVLLAQAVSPDALRFGIAVTVPGSLLALWLARNREAELYHRLFSPVAIAGVNQHDGTVDLSFRRAELWAEVGVLNGQLSPAALGDGAPGYRDPAWAPVAAAWTGPAPRRVPAWLAPAVGLVFLAGAAFVWFDLSAAEQAGREIYENVVIVLLCELGGKWLAAGFLAVPGLAILVGWAAWKLGWLRLPALRP